MRRRIFGQDLAAWPQLVRTCGPCNVGSLPRMRTGRVGRVSRSGIDRASRRRFGGRDDISRRIKNVESRAGYTQPERQVLSSIWKGNELEVLTTSQKLAHRIAREVAKAFGGKPAFRGMTKTELCWRGSRSPPTDAAGQANERQGIHRSCCAKGGNGFGGRRCDYLRRLPGAARKNHSERSVRCGQPTAGGPAAPDLPLVNAVTGIVFLLPESLLLSLNLPASVGFDMRLRYRRR